MDSHAAVTPPSHRSEARLLRSRPPPSLAQPFDDDSSDNNNNHHHATVVTPPPATKSPISPSRLHLALHASNHAPLQELLLLSHSAAARRQRSLVLVQGENVDPAANPRRKSKKSAVATAAASMGLMGCASPRNVRRARRRLEKEINREERQSDVFEDEVVRIRRRRQSKTTAPSRREKPSLVVAAPPPAPTPSLDHTSDSYEQSGLDGLREVISELIMWRNVAKSSLWFGLGSLFVISSSFSRDLSFCVVSAVSNVGLFILALAFFCDSISQRRHEKARKRFRFTEEDILRASRLVLPAVNAAIGTAQEVFSGEPSMTLKVAPVLLFAAKYGHHITLWRLLATGFFLSFTAPKLYASYSSQLLMQADSMRRSVLEAWGACRHKRVLVISAATMVWNLFSVKTRVFAAFICLVVLRYYRQKHSGEEGAVEGGELQADKEVTLQQEEETAQQRAFALVVVAGDEETTI